VLSVATGEPHPYGGFVTTTTPENLGAPKPSAAQLDVGFYVPPLPGDFVSVGDAELYVRTAGTAVPRDDPQAPVAVFIHGLGGSSTNWTELMTLLEGSVYGIAPDLPGFGQSPPPHHGDYKLTAHADIVAKLIREMVGERPVHVFGNSMGGATAVQLAARHPDLVKSMTLISPALPELRPRASNIHMPITAIPGVGERLMRRMMKRDVEWRVGMSMSICYADPDRIDPRRMADQVAEARARDALSHTAAASLETLRGLIATYFDYSQQAPWKLARGITVPVLLIYGRQDKLVNPRAAFRSTKEFPNASVMVVPDSGHVTQMEHPHIVEQAWRELVG
jgi:pimeloyl-ACP methyl ester carboxylesterase